MRLFYVVTLQVSNDNPLSYNATLQKLKMVSQTVLTRTAKLQWLIKLKKNIYADCKSLDFFWMKQILFVTVHIMKFQDFMSFQNIFLTKSEKTEFPNQSLILYTERILHP